VAPIIISIDETMAWGHQQAYVVVTAYEVVAQSSKLLALANQG
jgi:hypothetical protein